MKAMHAIAFLVLGLIVLSGCNQLGGQALGRPGNNPTIAVVQTEPVPFDDDGPSGGSNQCSDGTLPNNCSSTKPLFCQPNYSLVPDCLQCGCNPNSLCNYSTGQCDALQPCTGQTQCPLNHFCENEFCIYRTCTETDGGNNPWSASQTGIYVGGQIDPSFHPDACADSDTLTEYYCGPDNTLGQETVNCPNGCIDGACQPAADFCEVPEFSTSATFEKPLNSVSGTAAEFQQSLNTTNTAADSCYYLRESEEGPNVLLHPAERVGLFLNPAMEISFVQTKDLAAYMYPNDYTYDVNFVVPIDFNTDFNNGAVAFIPLFGKRYRITEMSTSPWRIRLQNDSNPSDEITLNRDQCLDQPTCNWISYFFVAAGGGNPLLWGIRIQNINYTFISNNPVYSPQSLYPESPYNHTAFPLELPGYSGLQTYASATFNGFTAWDGNHTDTNRSSIEFLKGQSPFIDTTAIHYGGIQYYDALGAHHQIPMAIYLPNTASEGIGATFQFDGIDHVYATNGISNPTRFRLKQQSTDTTFAGGHDFNVPMQTDLNHWDGNSVVSLYGPNGLLTLYFVQRSYTGGGVFLVLAGYANNQQFPFAGTIGQTTGNAQSIYFLGTSINDNSVNRNYLNYNTYPSGNNPPNYRPYYFPDLFGFTGQNTGSVTGVYRTAVFAVLENQGGSVPIFPTYVTNNTAWTYIDTEGGNAGTVDTGNNNKPNYTGKTTAIEYLSADQNLTSLSEYLSLPGQASSNYSKAYTDRGSRFILQNRVLTMETPWSPSPVTMTLTVGPPNGNLPDVTVSNVEYTGPSITYTTSNVGAAPTSGNLVLRERLKQCGTPWTHGDYGVHPSPMQPGETQNNIRYLPLLQNGCYEAEYFIDPLNFLTESNENNNQALFQFDVTGSSVDPNAPDFIVSGEVEHSYQNGHLSVTFRIRNIGGPYNGPLYHEVGIFSAGFDAISNQMVEELNTTYAFGETHTFTVDLGQIPSGNIWLYLQGANNGGGIESNPINNSYWLFI